MEFIGPKIACFLFLKSLAQINYPPSRKWSVNILSKPSWRMNSDLQGIMSSAIGYISPRLCKNIVRLQYFWSLLFTCSPLLTALSCEHCSFMMWTLHLDDGLKLGRNCRIATAIAPKLGKNLYESLTRLLWDPWLYVIFA